MEFAIPASEQRMMLVAHCGESTMEVDLYRFYFGDGEWVPVIHGDDLFS